MTKYSAWLHYFAHNQWTLAEFPWHETPQLDPTLRSLLASSLPQFQLGEASDGRGLLHRAESMGAQHQEPDLASAMKLFIREEQRHSAALGRVLDQEQIPRLREHWVDSCFRRIRSLAGFEFMLMTLSSAECIAVPYYTALYEATDLPLLQRLSLRILRDEAFHLEFQAENLALCAQHRGEAGRLLTVLLQVFLLCCAMIFVFLLYRRLFAKVKMSPLRFLGLALSAYRPIFDRLARHRSWRGSPAAGWLH